MTTTGRIRRLTLQDPPAISGLEARFFADASDYARLSELTVAANEFDEIPYLPSAADLKVEMEAAEGLDPVDDVVFVEVDGPPDRRDRAPARGHATTSRPTTSGGRSMRVIAGWGSARR